MADTQHNAGIRISGDASGAVDATKQLGEEQKKLTEQTRKTGESAKAAAEESKRFVERLKEQAETMGKGGAGLERYRASQLSLTDAQKKSVDASLAQIQAYDKKQQALQFVSRAAAVATVAIIAYGTAVAIGVKNTIDQAAALHNLSQSYGVSVETLSAYRYQMNLAGISQEEFTFGIKALVKNIAEARAGTGDGAALFKLLGKDIESAVRSGASLDVLVPQIAQKFSSWTDGINKTALAMAFFGGRIGEKLIPELNKGAEGFRAAAREAEQMAAILGGDLARRSEELNTNLARMNTLLGASRITIAESVVPALNTMIEKFIEARREGDGLASAAFRALRAGAGPGDVQIAQRDLVEATDRKLQIANDMDRLKGLGGWAAARGRERLQREMAEVDERIARSRAVIAVNEPGFFANTPQATASKPPAPVLPDPGAEAARLAEVKRQTQEVVESAQKRVEWEERQGEAFAKANEAFSERIQELNAEREMMALSAPEREKLLEFRRIDLQVLQASTEATDEQREALARWGDEAKQAYLDVLEAKTRLADQDERIKAGIQQQSAIDEQAARSAQTFEQAVATGIMLGFRRGGGTLAQQLRRTIEDAIATAALTPIATRIASPFGQIGTALSGQGSPMLTGWLNQFAVSDWGQKLGMSSLTEDAAGNVTVSPNNQAVSNISSAMPYIGAAIAAAYAMRSKQSRQDFDSLARDYEAKLGMEGSKRAQYNPVGGWLSGDLSFKEMLVNPPGLIRHKGDTRRSGGYAAGFGEFSGDPWADNRWFGGDMTDSLLAYNRTLAGQEQNLIRNMQLSPEQIARVNAALAGPNATRYDFGPERTPWEQSQAFEQIRVDRLNAISQALGRSVEQLTKIMVLSAEQFAAIEKELRNQLADVKESFGGFIRGLPGRLGIPGLEEAQQTLAVSEYRAPLDRLSSARGIYESTLARARAGELDAVSAFPQVAQQLLGIGRDVYASGPQFQELFVEANRALNEVLEQQRGLQTDILKEVPVAIMEASRDQITEIKRQTTTLLEALRRVETEIRLLRAAA